MWLVFLAVVLPSVLTTIAVVHLYGWLWGIAALIGSIIVIWLWGWCITYLAAGGTDYIPRDLVVPTELVVVLVPIAVSIMIFCLSFGQWIQ